jgi:RNA polymerase sigma-70 factor (ECF subfamily)
MATLVVLEQLTPAERAAFLLREGFDVDYREIARLLERSEPATRQLVRRARSHIDAERVRFETTRETHMALLLALGHAMQTGDLAALQRHLAADVRFVSDGRGKAAAALKPVHGATAVGRLLIGLHQKFGAAQTHVPRTLNGQPGVVTVEGERVVAAVVFCIADGRVTAVYSVRNPDKLAAL